MDPMCYIYFNLVKKELKTIDEIPDEFKADVQTLLDKENENIEE